MRLSKELIKQVDILKTTAGRNKLNGTGPNIDKVVSILIDENVFFTQTYQKNFQKQN